MQQIKHIAIDILGGFLIIAAGLLGWVPGPGGIPLFLAGLGLLAINHEWARRWLKKAESGSLRLSKYFFRDHPLWKLGVDIIGLFILVVGIWLLFYVTKSLIRATAIAVIIIGLSLILGNRRRLKKLLMFFTK